MKVRNLLQTLAGTFQEEQAEVLLTSDQLTLERIISPPHFQSTLFLQAHDEWVLLLRGDASLQLDSEVIELTQGDSLLIPADCPHQVIDTSEQPTCIWLALHLPAT